MSKTKNQEIIREAALKRLAELCEDERMNRKAASVVVNSPLALMQSNMSGEILGLRLALGITSRDEYYPSYFTE